MAGGERDIRDYINIPKFIVLQKHEGSRGTLFRLYNFVHQVHNEMLVAAGVKTIWIAGGGDLAGQIHDAGQQNQEVTN